MEGKRTEIVNETGGSAEQNTSLPELCCQSPRCIHTPWSVIHGTFVEKATCCGAAACHDALGATDSVMCRRCAQLLVVVHKFYRGQWPQRTELKTLTRRAVSLIVVPGLESRRSLIENSSRRMQEAGPGHQLVSVDRPVSQFMLSRQWSYRVMELGAGGVPAVS